MLNNTGNCDLRIGRVICVIEAFCRKNYQNRVKDMFIKIYLTMNYYNMHYCFQEMLHASPTQFLCNGKNNVYRQ